MSDGREEREEREKRREQEEREPEGPRVLLGVNRLNLLGELFAHHS